QALSEEQAPSKESIAMAALAVLRNPRRNYGETISVLQELGDKHSTQAAAQFILGLALVEAQRPDVARMVFARGQALGGDPAQVVPSQELHSTVRKIVTDEKTTWPVAASTLEVLATQFPQDGQLASYYAFTLFLSDNVQRAASEIARARSLGTDPQA